MGIPVFCPALSVGCGKEGVFPDVAEYALKTKRPMFFFYGAQQKRSQFTMSAVISEVDC